MPAKTTKKKLNEKNFKTVKIDSLPKLEPQPQKSADPASPMGGFKIEEMREIFDLLRPKYNVNLFIEVRYCLPHNQHTPVKIRRFTKPISLTFAPIMGMFITGFGYGANRQVITILFDVQNDLFVCGLEPETVFTEESFEQTTDSYGNSGWFPLA